MDKTEADTSSAFPPSHNRYPQIHKSEFDSLLISLEEHLMVEPLLHFAFSRFLLQHFFGPDRLMVFDRYGIAQTKSQNPEIASGKITSEDASESGDSERIS